MTDINEGKEYDNGQVKISDEVVATIAGLAAVEIEGVYAMSGGFTGGISDILGRKNLSKGVKVEVGEKEASVDLYIIVKYGSKIPDVAWKIQEAVKDAIVNMTGLKVVGVNIHVQGVELKEAELEEEKNS
ncbi:MAG: Asp23/Gls24 family envelope stress response protein [Senegalia sp. (in: firmicutes)]|uniref:Asp23/Gls24 family envelope stress response protein n=1 Tax=Senegalia sp. (in: firmicutes) TaxID=1924098 RepID=UPI003F9E35CE